MTIKLKHSFGILILLFSVLVFVSAQHANATATTQGDPTAEENVDPNAPPPNEAKGILNSVVFKGEEYKRSNYENMSHVFWLFDMPDLNNNEDVDIFLQINECDLFKKYYGDEFEWGPLREVMRDFLKKNKETFSRKLYFDLPIQVGKYNVENGHFGVESKNFASAERDFFPHPSYVGWNKDFCGFRRMDNRLKKVYPREALFRFIRPISIPHIKVEEEIAKELVKQWKEEEIEKRYLAIRLYITITKFMGFQDFHNQKSIPIYLSYINGYEIYEDLEMDHLLYTKSYLKKTKKKPVVKNPGVPNPDNENMSEPKEGDEYDDFE